ncbi:peptide synthetase [Streptomyces ziwulingensis]|uniref:Condensation domain-containing protein n=1 Tax=Streptomyces ziwulingensis TaxID=1045501 RepID=A0ABP9CZU2_9ACTN
MPEVSPGGAPVRSLGAFERAIDLYMWRNPVQFSLVAEVGHSLAEAELKTGLARLQDLHPLLRVAVDRDGPAAVYRETDGLITVGTAAPGTPWQAVVIHEQTRPIPAHPGPLARAVLIPAAEGCSLVLTFAHQITDGTGALRVLLDLLAVLDSDGDVPKRAPSGVPQAQEDLLARLEAAPDTGDAEAGPSAEDDERMHAAGELRPFSGRPPHVDALALDRDLTARLVARCRTEEVSVHAALCAAACTVFHRGGRDFVRVLSPVDLRRAAGLPDDVANRFAGARTASTADDAKDFWALARHHHQGLARQRTPGVLRTGSAVLVQHPPTTPEEAEAMMAAVTAADIQITNLGAAGPDAAGLGVSALWGPAQITQLRGEHVLGVVTVGGRLRMTELTHDPVPALVPGMAAVLAQACAEPLPHT